MKTPQIPAPGPEAWAQRLTESLVKQRDLASKFLAAQQKRFEQAEAFIGQQFERLEDELRQARNKNAELQQQLARARATATKLAQQAQKPGRLDWEAEKRRIVAALEADGTEDDEAQKVGRLQIAEAVRVTEEVIAAKDREIQELKLRLEERGDDDAAIAVLNEQTINDDAAICEERERLRQMQAEWQERLRQAEVELALERAKIARQRADLEEQLRMVDDAPPQPPHATDTEGRPAPSAHGRWLAQLGLTVADREPPRHVL